MSFFSWFEGRYWGRGWAWKNSFTVNFTFKITEGFQLLHVITTNRTIFFKKIQHHHKCTDLELSRQLIAIISSAKKSYVFDRVGSNVCLSVRPAVSRITNKVFSGFV